jgi:hypothetical protein
MISTRAHGISVIHQRLARRRDGYGGLVITRNYRNLIRQLPQMVTAAKTRKTSTNPASNTPSML